MKQEDADKDLRELSALCDTVRTLVRKGAYRECETLITAAMDRYPHAPQPHNLMGILLEKTGERVRAMRHFRAAWALDPAYIPARCNLNRFASFYPKGTCTFDETDCPRHQAGEPIAVSSMKSVIERQALLNGAAARAPVGEGRLNVAEVPIAQTAPITGKKIWEIDLPADVIIGCILRGEQSIVPRGDTRILAGDVLILISADKQQVPAIRKLTGSS